MPEDDYDEFEEEKTVKRKKRRVNPKKLFIVSGGFLAVIVIIALVIGFTSGGVTGATVANLEPECHEEIQEYNETTLQPEAVPQEKCETGYLRYNTRWQTATTDCLHYECAESVKECLEWNFWHTTCEQEVTNCVREECSSFRLNCGLKISNTDTESGSWSLDGHIIYGSADMFVRTITKQIQPMSEATFSWTYTTSTDVPFACDYKNMKIPTKESCHTEMIYTDMPKTETKYRTVEVCD